jgi:uncharacterized protein YpmS
MMTIEKRNRFLLLVVTALLGASLACNLPSRLEQAPENTPIPVTTEAVENLQNNVASAAATAQSGQPVTLTVTEAQLTSLVAFEAEKQSEKVFQDPQVLLRDGQVQVLGKVKQSGISLPLKIVLTISADAQGKPHYQVVSANLGPLPLPQAILDQLTAQLDQAMADQLNTASNNVFVEKIDIAGGVMTITGRTR